MVVAAAAAAGVAVLVASAAGHVAVIRLGAAPPAGRVGDDWDGGQEDASCFTDGI